MSSPSKTFNVHIALAPKIYGDGSKITVVNAATKRPLRIRTSECHLSAVILFLPKHKPVRLVPYAIILSLFLFIVRFSACKAL